MRNVAGEPSTATRSLAPPLSEEVLNHLLMDEMDAAPK
jgi:hypothetical protein